MAMADGRWQTTLPAPWALRRSLSKFLLPKTNPRRSCGKWQKAIPDAIGYAIALGAGRCGLRKSRGRQNKSPPPPTPPPRTRTPCIC
jgi:hypothetical protein